MVATPMCDERFTQPEQLASREVSIRSGLHSLGLILHEMFSQARLRRSATGTTPPTLNSLVSDVDPTLKRHSALPFRGAGLPSAERAHHRRCRLRVVDSRWSTPGGRLRVVDAPLGER